MNVSVGGHHEYRDRWFGLTPFLEHRHAVIGSESQVANDQVHGGFECVDGFGAVARRDGVVAFGFEQSRKRFSLPNLVFDHQNCQCCVHKAGRNGLG